ncbi:ABC transporter substrate-binding protein [Sinanaerobacter sp. ZZT-01]|uniref:ABC transporter substrate-binding protein n=1 Tax=Sinanaerobacter sp. ZZT-01 TaxID=3111540 RepID=UPI002D791335|nr:ABC transporter substrate-binding protein [Sinanaerobacter sp. ZZT-01]WRR93198.1 ABC transporter substrate-binding protein [Sinanaerobacter sp. ZZT-01]
MFKKKLLFILAILLGCTSITACSKAVPFLSNSDEEQAQVTTSNEVKVPIHKIRSLNPLNTADEDAYYINKLIYEGLFALDETLQAVPVLVSSYEYNQEKASLTIHLKNGVKWHDGTNFTADDVKYSINSYLSASYSSTFLYKNSINKIKSAAVNGSQSITITFKSAKDMAVENLTFPIMPKPSSKKEKSMQTATTDFKPIGTGPYKIKEINGVQEIILEGFSGYHASPVPSNVLTFRVVPDQTDAINLFEIQDLSIAFSKEINRDTFLNNNDAHSIPFPSNEIELVGFNVNKLTDKTVRKAIAYTINAEEIMETGYFRSGVLNDSLYYPGYLGSDEKENLLKVDYEKAKELLTKAGYIDRDGDGILEDTNNEELTIQLLVNADNSSRKVAAQTIKTGLEKLGIRVQIEEKNWDAYQSALSNKNYDIYVGGYRIAETFDLRFLLHSQHSNPADYSNTKLDTLLDKMQSGVTEEQRKNTFSQIKEILSEDMPYYCLFYKTYGVSASSGLKGEITPTFFDIYRGCSEWRCEFSY